MPFALGTETWGSIVSPARRCGATGLRPTFGRVSRHGVMALAWTLDKVGVIARSGALLRLGAGARSPAATRAIRAAVDRGFDPDPQLPVAGLRVGVAEALFAGEYAAGDEESRALDRAMLETLAGLGVELVPLALPELPIEPLAALVGAEAGAAFDELTLSGGVDAMVRQTRDAWPNVLRAARFLLGGRLSAPAADPHAAGRGPRAAARRARGSTPMPRRRSGSTCCSPTSPATRRWSCATASAPTARRRASR